MEALVGAFNQEKAPAGAFSVIANLRLKLWFLFGSLMFVAVDCEAALDCSNFQLGHISIGIIMYCLQADGSFQATFNFKVYKDV